jgi:hypothetical protein
MYNPMLQGKEAGKVAGLVVRWYRRLKIIRGKHAFSREMHHQWRRCHVSDKDSNKDRVT